MTPYAPMQRGPTTIFDIETVGLRSARDRIMSEVYDPSTFTPKNNAKKDDVIARQREEAAAEFESERELRASKLCLSPRTGRIVTSAIWVEGCSPTVIMAETEEEEALLLTTTWQYLRAAGLVVTFNGMTFDLPYTITRSILRRVGAGIDASSVVPLLKRYSYRPHFDIRQALTNWDKFGTGTLDEWAELADLTRPVGSGSQVQAWYDAGDFASIEAHALGDLHTTSDLFNLVAPFYVANAMVAA